MIRLSDCILFLALLVAAVAGHGHGDPSKCPNDCAPNGSCVDGVCECNAGFAGADCSFPFQTCPDGILTCFDGAVCNRISLRQDKAEAGGKSQYECDCSTIPEASPFQIAECESPDSQACVAGQATSDYAFCTNGGTCVKTVATGEPHAGCICPNDFEGRHCQYRKGTAPDIELKLAYEEKEHHIEGFFLFLIIVVSGLVLFGFGYMVYTLKNKSETQGKSLDDTMEDIELDEAPTTDTDDMPQSNGELA